MEGMYEKYSSCFENSEKVCTVIEHNAQTRNINLLAKVPTIQNVKQSRSVYLIVVEIHE